MSFHVPNKYRIRSAPLASSDSDGNNGAFLIGSRALPSSKLLVIASDGGGWDHVSVSRPDRCPTWAEMCRVKDLFWDPEDFAVQYHPPIDRYVNNHPFCLHLWRPTDCGEMPFPPDWMVGVKGLSLEQVTRAVNP